MATRCGELTLGAGGMALLYLGCGWGWLTASSPARKINDAFMYYLTRETKVLAIKCFQMPYIWHASATTKDQNTRMHEERHQPA